MRSLISYSFVILAFSLYTGVTGNDSYNLLPKHFEIIGFSASETGFIMGFTGIGAMLMLPFVALFIDHFRQKRILTGALIIQLCIPLFYFLEVPFPRLYAAARFVQGGTFSVMMISYTAALSFIIPSDRRSWGYAIFGIMGQLGGLTSFALGESIYDAYGFFPLYVFTLVLFGISITLIQFFPEKKNFDDSQKPKLSDFGAVFKQKQLYPALYWILILGLAFGTMLSFIPKIIMERGLEKVGPFFIAYPLTVALLRLTLGSFFDRFSKKIVLFIPIIMVPVSLFMVSIVHSYALLIIAGICYGVAHGVMFPVLLAYLMEHAPVQFRARMSLIFQFLFNFGLFLSANIGGYIAEISVRWTFIGMALFSITGVLLLCYLIIYGKTVKRSIP